MKWLVILLASLAVVILNWPGNVIDIEPVETTSTTRHFRLGHGFPLLWLERSVSARSFEDVNEWSFSGQAVRFMPWNLLINVALAAFVVCLYLKLRRSVPRWGFTLRAMLGTVAVVAVICGWMVSSFSESRDYWRVFWSLPKGYLFPHIVTKPANPLWLRNFWGEYPMRSGDSIVQVILHGKIEFRWSEEKIVDGGFLGPISIISGADGEVVYERFTVDYVRRLESQPHIATLTLDSYQIDADAWERLRSLPNFERIILRNCTIGPDREVVGSRTISRAAVQE